MKTKLSRPQLRLNAEALGFDPDDGAALIAAAMVADPEFREKITRFYFERWYAEVNAA